MEPAPVSITEKIRELSGQKSLHEEGQECNASGPGEGKRKAGQLVCHLVSISGIRECWGEGRRYNWLEILQVTLNMRGTVALRKSYIFLEESP